MPIGVEQRRAIENVASGLKAAQRRSRAADDRKSPDGSESEKAARPVPPIVPVAFAFVVGCAIGVASGIGPGDVGVTVPSGAEVSSRAWFAASAVAGLGWCFRTRRRRSPSIATGPLEQIARHPETKTHPNIDGPTGRSSRRRPPRWKDTSATIASVVREHEAMIWSLAACLLLGAGHACRAVSIDAQQRANLSSPDGSPRIVVFRGMVASEPALPRRRDRLHRFLPLGSDPGVDLRAVSIFDRDGRAWDLDGPVRLIVRHGSIPFPIGTLVEGEGLLHGERRKTNPGGTLPPRATLVGSPLATIVVPDIRLLGVRNESPGVLDLARARLAEIRVSVRDRVRSAFRQMLDSVEESVDTPARRTLLDALVLGIRRGEGFERLRTGFAAAGLAHFLAISGFNLAVLAGVAAVGARLLGVRPRRRGAIVVSALACYIAVLPAALPVMRAGATAMLMAVGSMFARRWDGRAATALAAIALLAIAPGEVVRPGFQLSFGAVFTLQAIAPRLRRRWFGEPDRLARSRSSVIRSRLADATAAAVSAWAVSTPIAAAHFGMIALLGVPATLIATPVVAAIVTTSAVALPISMASPGVAPVAGWMLDAMAGTLVGLAEIVESVPGGHRIGSPPGWVLATTTGLAIAGWLAAPPGVACRRARIVAIVAVAFAIAGMLPSPRDRDRLAATFLDVGDGASIVVEAGGSVVLVDAGSLNRRTVGSGVVVPALVEMGVRRLDAIVVSHPNLDHFSGLAEVIDAVAVDRIVVGEAFMQAVRDRPAGAEAASMSIVRDRSIPIRVVAAGDRMVFADGASGMTCLHPPTAVHGKSDAEALGANDASLAWRVDRDDLDRPFVATLGDLESAGLEAVMETVTRASPMVAEVPHHGSVTEETVRLLAALPDTVWIQSTGPKRLRPDRLGAALAEANSLDRRLVTARDGAVRVTLSGADGGESKMAVTLERFGGPGDRW